MRVCWHRWKWPYPRCGTCYTEGGCRCRRLPGRCALTVQATGANYDHAHVYTPACSSPVSLPQATKPADATRAVAATAQRVVSTINWRSTFEFMGEEEIKVGVGAGGGGCG